MLSLYHSVEENCSVFSHTFSDDGCEQFAQDCYPTVLSILSLYHFMEENSSVFSQTFSDF